MAEASQNSAYRTAFDKFKRKQDQDEATAPTPEAVWKRDEQELNAAPSQFAHDFEIASLQRMVLTQNPHRTGEVAEMGSL